MDRKDLVATTGLLFSMAAVCYVGIVGMDDNKKENIAHAKEVNSFEEYTSTTRLSGQDVLDLIYSAPEDKIAVLVKANDKPDIIRNYGHRLGAGQDYEFQVSEVFLGQKDTELPFNLYADTSVGESWVNINNLTEEKVKFTDTDDHPLIEVKNEEGDISLATEFLYTSQEPTDVITQEEDLSFINEYGRYLSTVIKDDEDVIVGVYVEEFESPLEYAVLGNLLHATMELKSLDNYPIGDGAE